MFEAGWTLMMFHATMWLAFFGTLTIEDNVSNTHTDTINMAYLRATVKEECRGEIIKEFVGLKAKLYSLKMENDLEYKRAKGVKKNVLDRCITFDDYKKCLLENFTLKDKQCYIQSKNHVLFSVEQVKVLLNSEDDKRVLIPGTFYTVPHGHIQLS